MNSITSFLARASPIHCRLPTPKGTRAGCFLYLSEKLISKKISNIKIVDATYLPSSPMNLSGLKVAGFLKVFGSLMMNCRLDMKAELGGKVNPSTSSGLWSFYFSTLSSPPQVFLLSVPKAYLLSSYIINVFGNHYFNNISLQHL